MSRLELLYDRAGRSEGVAYVTYESAHDAATAIREFDGANANGQPIRLLPVNDAPRRRNPFDSAGPSRSLEDRISFPSSRDRSYSPRPSNVRGPAPPNVDRYVPGDRSSRSPRPPRRRDGRPPGARRERGERSERPRGGGREAGARPERRPKKTQEELDAEMDDYWGASKANGGEDAAASTSEPVAAAPISQDVEMIE